MSLKKRETNQNKIRHPGRKRKIIATIALSLSLLFGKTLLSSSQSSSTNFDNKVVQERVTYDQWFCSLKDNDQQVILAKTGDSGPAVPNSPGRGYPNNFLTPPAGGRPSRRVYIPKYRTVPKVVPGPGLGAGANLAAVGGAVELLNSMIGTLFQKIKNHKNQNLIMIILLMLQRRKSNELNNAN